MASTVPCLAVRGSNGISLSNGPPTYTEVSSFTKDDSKSCKAMIFSPDGRYFAWISGPTVKIAITTTWQTIAVLQKPKVSAIKFSTLGNYLMTWEPFIVSQANPQGGPQLHIWKSATGDLVKSFTQKRQSDWEPQWSSDEKIFAILINSEVIFYENADFETVTYRFKSSPVRKFRISTGVAPYHVMFYLPGKSGEASFARLFEYPKFEMSQGLANKGFFQDDRVDIYWNKKGTSALILTSMDVDRTGSTYYGTQSLHYLSVSGETAVVALNDDGPIHAVDWSPKNTEFCVIHGLMPSKATLYNLKCEVIFEFGKKHRNSIYYNPQGNILLLGGFGNLPGGIELWDMTRRKVISQTEAPDTTLLEWSPDGEHFMTATTAPRLRVANGFKIWHYSGTLLYERPWNKQELLWEVLWQVYPNVFPEKAISYKVVEGIVSSQPQASKEAYRPPSARGKIINFKLRDDVPNIPTRAEPSKAALKARKNREAKKARKELEGNDTAFTNGRNPSSRVKSQPMDPDPTVDPEKDKTIKKIRLKLKQITKLKEQLTSGKKLEGNQLDKIKKEDELLKELNDLML